MSQRVRAVLVPGVAAARLQLQLVRHTPDYWGALVQAPLYTTMFLSILDAAGREDLSAFGVVGAALMVLWSTTVFLAGDIMAEDRFSGRFELHLATPTGVLITVFGRVASTVTFGSSGLALAWLVARFGFGLTVAVEHKAVALATILATLFAMMATGALMAGTFVFGRDNRSFQRTLSIPFFLLSGVVVPVEYLPGWVQPFSRVIFLSWTADLLRDSATAETVPHAGWRIGAILVLGLAALVGAWHVMRVVLHRVKATGTVGQV